MGELKSPVLHGLHRESGRRYLETKKAKPSEVVSIKAAIAHEVLAVFFEENPTLALAKQGLYEDANFSTILHPDNEHWIGKTIEVHLDESGSYKLGRDTYDSLMKLLSENPDSMYNN